MRQVGVGRREIEPGQDPVAMAQHVFAEHAHGALARQQEAEQDREGGGLAGTVAAEQRRGRAALDGKADAADRHCVAVAFDEIIDGDDGRGHRLHMAIWLMMVQHRMRAMDKGSPR
jgi:hypothetical protein